MTNPPETENEPKSVKFYKVTYLSDGVVDVESNDMTAMDLWALSRYIELQADQIYLNVLAQERIKKAAEEANSTIVPAGEMPLSLHGPGMPGMNRESRRHGNRN